MGNSQHMCGKSECVSSRSEVIVSIQNDKLDKQPLKSRMIQKILLKPVFHKVNRKTFKNDNVCTQVIGIQQNQPQPEDQPDHTQYQYRPSMKVENDDGGDHKDDGLNQDEEMGQPAFSLEDIMQEEEKKLQQRKIGVNWNSFVKIKKKSYLQDYIFISQIGKGAYGQVAKLKMKYGGMLRAAKIIKSSIITAQKANKGKLFAEISLPMKLDHANLVKLFQVFEHRGQYILILQLCEGGDLFNYIKESRFFSQAKAAQIIKQILSAINYMHKQGVMHRDLKPQNILVDRQNDTLKIGDFGTATPYNPTSKFSQMVGTPYYIAPEILNGCYNYKCDIWSCGIILYILLCGSPPFNGKSDKEILQKIKLKPLDFRNAVWKKRNKLAKELIVKMLAKNPQDRITAQQALNSEWLQNTGNVANLAASRQKMQQVQKQVINNLKSFHFQNKLKAVVYTYIASQLYSSRDKDHLLSVFREIDKDGDGVIQKAELISVFNNHARSNLSEGEIIKILELVDTNGSGQIDFTQFLVAASNEEKMLEEKRLENAFDYLDADHSGFITIQEVKAFLDGTTETSEEIKQIFDEVDANGDGQISKQQFIALLLKKD